ncbi:MULTISPECIES: cytochrome c oxidase subunit II [Nocardioides]|mgnify:CR=1 FL=1|uniref:cytochrome-c oxidase n=2 Tax=Nocardioides TaxID=1839 RepID=A0ABT8TQA0_9ACTN|nr:MULTISPECIES: cytochrome c oxidase subunit II [Nocardioides]MBM7506799.1 cytochrome c oxidase subunit 2 [Nocardioides salarius]MDO3396128.1 cytochrome c oxidase subunit II [Nocardioides cremeus]
MSLQLPQMAPGRRRASARRAGLGATLGLGLVLLAGCSSESRGEWERLAMPEPITEQGESTLALWQGAWIAALITGVVVWGLIAWVVVAYRRRSDDEVPVQTRYNLPLEIFYTVAPIMMVVVFFAQTIRVQDIVLEESPAPDNIVEVTAQKWSWTFNHGIGAVDVAADEDNEDDEFPYEGYAYLAGTLTDIPTLVLPVGETTRFNLHSPDVIHDFGVPAFLIKMDVIPGRVNSFEVTPTTEGTFKGKCYELCGAYHSRMLFNVEVVSAEEYDAYVADLADSNLASTGVQAELPILGGEDARTQVGLASTRSGGEGQ